MKWRINNQKRRVIKDLRESSNSLFLLLNEWYQSPLGARVVDNEKQKLQETISHLFGYHILQVGGDENLKLIENSPVGHKIIFSPFLFPGTKTPVANIEELPLANDSIDIILVYHALDFTIDSHRLLRELTRVLRPGGQMLIVGFNPLSLWGIFRLFMSKRNIPWMGRFLSLRRLSDWLKLLNLQIESVNYVNHFLPFSYRKILARVEQFEKIGEKMQSPFGGSYIVHCEKTAIPITPIVTKRIPIASRVSGFPLTENIRAKIQ